MRGLTVIYRYCRALLWYELGRRLRLVLPGCASGGAFTGRTGPRPLLSSVLGNINS